MRHASAVVVLGFLLAASSASAQEWSEAQLEVWAFEESCWQDFASQEYEEWLTCFHPDFVGWFSTNPTPMPFHEGFGRHYMESSPVRIFALKPFSILIHGNVAIVHYSAHVIRTGPDGKDQAVWEHWTDVAVKEDGRWSWIADHGHN